MDSKTDGKRRGPAAATEVRPDLSVSTYLSPCGLATQTGLLPQVAANIYITTHTSEMTFDLFLHHGVDPCGMLLCCSAGGGWLSSRQLMLSSFDSKH